MFRRLIRWSWGHRRDWEFFDPPIEVQSDTGLWLVTARMPNGWLVGEPLDG